MALFNNNRNQRGTGFTNINRVLGANQGNKLGNTVVNNVQGQANNVRSNVQQSQNKFEEESQKNRLDTDEAKQKRENVIGRFNESNYAPDMSNFQVSSGLQTQYDTAKQKYEADKATQQGIIDSNNPQLSNYQTQLKAQQDKVNQTSEGLAGPQYKRTYNGLWHTRQEVANPQRQAQLAAIANEQASLAAIQKQYDAANSQILGANTAIQGVDANLTKLQKEFDDMTAAEQDIYKKSEIDKLMAANVPTEQEITDFTKYRTGTYTGPNELNDFQTLLGKASEAEQVGDLTRSTGGRQELLRRFVGGNDYTQGQQRLDTMLLGQQNQGELNQARKATRGLEQDTTEANSLAGAKAQEYVNRAKIFGEETVGKLNDARNPISGKVDERLKAIQEQEANQAGFHKSLSDTLLGQGDNVKGLDRITRLGLGLQQARDAGFINDAQVAQMLGDGGLISRAESLGLDTNKLINERLTNQAGKNINRGGAATAVQESQMNALDRLLGRQSTDVEFNQAGADYERGNMGFNLDSLNEYLSKSEKEKYANDAAKMAEIEAYNKRYLNQAVANGQGAIQNAANAGGALMTNLADPNSYYDPGQMGQNLNNFAQGAGGAAINGINAHSQGQNAFLEGLTKLNIGGNSLANTEGGRQLLKAIELKSKMENEAAAAGGKILNNYGTGTQDLLSGDIAGGLSKLTGADLARNLGTDLSRNLSKSVSDAASSAANAVASICFGGDTNLLMSDNTYKNIKDIKLGDEMKAGGRIVIYGQAFASQMFDYNGIQVTGDHAVFENGTWTRVKDSKLSKPIEGSETIVYPIINEKHIMITEGQIWADMFEVDDYEGRSKEDILKQLNNDVERNTSLLGLMDEIKEIK